MSDSRSRVRRETEVQARALLLASEEAVEEAQARLATARRAFEHMTNGGPAGRCPCPSSAFEASDRARRITAAFNVLLNLAFDEERASE